MSGIKMAEPLTGYKPRAWEGPPRICPGCGKRVGKYNHPRDPKAYCYTCDEKQPWTWLNLGPTPSR